MNATQMSNAQDKTNIAMITTNVIHNFVRLAQIAPKRTIAKMEYAILAMLTPELVKENSVLKDLLVKLTTPAKKMFVQPRTKMKHVSMLKSIAC